MTARGRTRRDFLRASLEAGAGGIALLVLACSPERSDPFTAIVELSGDFRDLDGVMRVGAEARALLPEGDDPERLLARLDPRRGGAVLREEIRAQHRSGETISLRGWPTALTEARLYALVAIARGEGAAG